MNEKEPVKPVTLKAVHRLSLYKEISVEVQLIPDHKLQKHLSRVQGFYLDSKKKNYIFITMPGTVRISIPRGEVLQIIIKEEQ